MYHNKKAINYTAILIAIVFVIGVIFTMTPVLDSMRKDVNPKTVTTSELVKLNEKYVSKKNVVVKYIEYSKDDPYFIFWTKKNTYIKVFYPNNTTGTVLLNDITTEYKLPDKSHPNGTKELLCYYESYKANTPSSVKNKLSKYPTTMGLGRKLTPNKPNANSLKLIIYKNAQ